MNEEIANELNYEIQLLIKSGFYNDDEILEIIEEEFFEENISLSEISSFLSKNKEFSFNQDNNYFINLKKAFCDLTKNYDILTIHNAGFDLDEGIQYSFELATHIQNNKLKAKGFCFYSFEDVELAIEESELSLTFGDFEGNEKTALNIGKIIVVTLEDYGFEIVWDGSLDNNIVIKPFIWEKTFDGMEYSMDGAAKLFLES